MLWMPQAQVISFKWNGVICTWRHWYIEIQFFKNTHVVLCTRFRFDEDAARYNCKAWQINVNVSFFISDPVLIVLITTLICTKLQFNFTEPRKHHLKLLNAEGASVHALECEC